MNFLKKVTKGKIQKPIFMVLFGPPGVGKSTFASEAPDVLFMGSEEGTFNMDVSRLPKAESYQEIMDTIDELRKEKHPYQTLAIDALDGIEPLVWDAVCKLDGSKSIEQAQGSYGKGYVMANKYWQEMINAILSLRNERGMNVIAIAHSQVKPFHDPILLQPYDRYQLKLNEKAAALWREAVDFLGFANFESLLKIGDDEKRNRALGTSKRILYTERRPSFDAKSRFQLPPEMPLSFSAFEKELKGKELDLRPEIKSMLDKMNDDEIKKKAIDTFEKAGTDFKKLLAIKNRLVEITGGT